jgi:group I intron endonuclease
MTCGIYSITNKNTGEMYIGQSVNIESRWKQHSYGQDYSKSDIDKAIKQLGKDQFIFKVLLECDKENLDYHEVRLIEEFDTFVHGYNLTKGGQKYWDNPTKYWSNAKKLRRGVIYSKEKSSSGIFRVHLTQQGYWQYMYKENGKRKGFSAKNLNKLKEKVLSKGLNWLIVDVQKANMSYEKDKEINRYTKDTNTGYFQTKCYNGVYKYFYSADGIKKALSSKDIKILEKKVKEHGLIWAIIDNQKAIETNKKSMLSNIKEQLQ